MKGYSSDQIRNVVLLGHGGSGKTTVAEAALLSTGVVSRLGRVEDGNTVSDYEKTEIEKGYSITTSVLPVEYNKYKINLLDTPGFFDFVGEVHSAIRAVEAAAIIVDASAGVQVGTEKAWNVCKKTGLPRFFLINKTDKENVNVDQVVADLKAKFGTSVVTFEDKDALNEAIAESDEALLDKFFGGEEFTEEEFKKGLSAGIAGGDIAPVIMSSAVKGEGIREFLDTILKYVPAPSDVAPVSAVNGKGEDIEVKSDAAGKTAAFVFKTIADPFVGKISLLKVMSGVIRQGSELFNAGTEKSEKMGSIFSSVERTRPRLPTWRPEIFSPRQSFSIPTREIP